MTVTDASGHATHELDAPPWLRVETTLMATATALRTAYDTQLAPLELNLSQASMLAYVNEFGPVSQTRAAEHLGQGRAVTGSHVDKLTSLGLVERRPNPDDKRVWLVAVTPQGEKMAAQVAAVDTALRTQLRRGISKGDRNRLAALLVRLQHNIATSDPNPQPEES